jgi:hypothetical protein
MAAAPNMEAIGHSLKELEFEFHPQLILRRPVA